MKPRNLIFAGLLLIGGCGDHPAPTSTRLEQAVFTALGGLDVGEAITFRGAAAGELVVNNPLSSEFVYIPFHASQQRGATLLVEISGVPAALDNAAGLSAPELSPALAGEGGEEMSWAMHEELHARLRAQVAPMFGPWRRAARLQSSTQQRSAGPLGGSNARVGQLVELNTSVIGLTCESVDLRTGRVEAIGDRSIIVADIDNPSGGFSRADYEVFSEEIDRLIFPTMSRYFGEPTDIDGNGRTVIFFTRAVNELTTRDRDGYVGGFFYGRDLFPVSGPGACAASNAAEILFILVPDPNAEASHIPHTREAIRRSALGTIGHEYQHLINAGGRIWGDAAAPEESWLDEGLSHIAEEVLFYADSGLQPRSNLGMAELTTPRALEALARFGIQNLQRYDLYLATVTRQSPTNRNDDLATRGAAWSFLRYVADQSARSEESFFRALVGSSQTGFENLAQVLDDAPLEWFRRWGVSVYTDDLVSGPDRRLQQPSWNFRQVLPRFLGRFALEVRTLFPGEEVRFNLVSTSSGYVQVGGANQPERFIVTSGAAPPPSALQVTVVRIR